MIPQHGQYSEYELGIAAYNYNTAVMTDWPLLPYGLGWMVTYQKYTSIIAGTSRSRLNRWHHGPTESGAGPYVLYTGLIPGQAVIMEHSCCSLPIFISSLFFCNECHLLTIPWCLTNRLLVYYWVHVKSYRQSSSEVTIRLLWSEIPRLNTKNTNGDCSWKRRSSRDIKTSEEDNVHEINVRLSDTKPSEILSQIFLSFYNLWEYPCTCLFSRTCDYSLLTNWFLHIRIEAIVWFNSEPFSSHPYNIIILC
jgi:hypothetical protein